MKKELQKVLKSLDDVDFRELEHAVNIASFVRKIKRQYDLSNKDLVQMLNDRMGAHDKKYTIAKVVSMMDGSFPYDMLTISRLEGLNAKLMAEKEQKDYPLVTVASMSK